MAKAPKTPAIPVTPDNIDKAADTGAIKRLVAISDAFHRAGVHGPFEIGLPVLGSVHIADKGYRKTNIPAGTKVKTRDMAIGARSGLIFRFDIIGTMQNPHGTAEWIELTWDDVVDALLEFAERVVPNGSGDIDIKVTDEQLKGAIKANKAMHKILSEGFEVAQTRSRETAKDESMSTLDGYGSF